MEERWNSLRHCDAQGHSYRIHIHLCGNILAKTDLGNNHVYFRASMMEPTHYELWKTDGTSSGTVMVNDTITGIQAQFWKTSGSSAKPSSSLSNDGTQHESNTVDKTIEGSNGTVMVQEIMTVYGTGSLCKDQRNRSMITLAELQRSPTSNGGYQCSALDPANLSSEHCPLRFHGKFTQNYQRA